MERLDDHHDMVFYPYDLDPVWAIIREARGRIAFDIGANIGQAAKELAPNFGQVYSYEPCQESFDILEAECAENVEPIFMAVSNGPESIKLFEAESHLKFGELVSLDVVAGQETHLGRRRELPATTIDKEAAKYGIPSFIKIDVEGHELEVIAGGPETFAKGPQVLIEVHDKHFEGAIYNLLPNYDFMKMEHPFMVGQSIRDNHFWLSGLWKKN